MVDESRISSDTILLRRNASSSHSDRSFLLFFLSYLVMIFLQNSSETYFIKPYLVELVIFRMVKKLFELEFHYINLRVERFN